MPSFLHHDLLWTFGLPTLGVVAVPVLIHLINMMRHRRVEWAAMEFLLVSQKKHRTWIMLKQLLLLLLRMAAVAAVVLMIAQPRLHGTWGWLVGARIHHIVLLDDSFSMSDRWADTDAFMEAKKVAERIGEMISQQDRLQSFTLFRFSRIGRPGRGAEHDLLKHPVTSEFDDELKGLLAKIQVSQTAATPLAALQAVTQLLGENDGEHRVIYLISDFRSRDWNEPNDLRKELLRLSDAKAEIHLIQCVDRARPNLAIASLTPAEGIRAAGVPWFMDVAVRNFSPTVARDVSVTLTEDGHGRPAVTIAEIPPGQTAVERFLVHFRDAGPHEITAMLEADAVAIDSSRYCAVDLPADLPVLLIDGDSRMRDARYLSFALSPGESVRTGMRPRIEPPRHLGTKPLADIQAINLANIERLDRSAVEALEQYVSAGGGVAFFMGDNCDAKFFNEVLYRDGRGLFPAPLARKAELAVDRLETAPDIQVEPHFIFRVFSSKQNGMLQTVSVERYFAVPDGWRPPAQSTARVIARLRNGAPLAVERSFGKGRVVAFLTTAAPTWNNWAKNPSFVVAMQDLEAYLSHRPATAESRLVGSPLELDLDPARYQPQVRFMLPEETGSPSEIVDVARTNQKNTISFYDTDRSGFYEAQLTRIDNSQEIRRYAMNVDPTEGDLAIVTGEQLAPRLEGVKYRYDQAAVFQAATSDETGSNLGEVILYGLILLLIGEQILAYSASYHPARATAASTKGAAA
jgi:hypothetical protein